MANHSTIQDDLSHEATESALNACYNSFDRKERYVGATCCATEDMVLYTQVTSSKFSDGAPVVKQFDRDGIAGTLLFRKGETFRCVTFRPDIAEDEGEATSYMWDARTQTWHRFDAMGHNRLAVYFDLSKPDASAEEQDDEALVSVLAGLLP